MPEVEYHPSLSSTNDYAREYLENYKNLDVVWALEQKSGRGRGHRKWNSLTKKSLTFSIIVEKQKKMESLAISIIIATSICKTLKKWNEKISPNIKWPNDILIKKKKVGGILVDNTPKHWIVGIGLNISHNKEELDKLHQEIAEQIKTYKNTPYFATSLFYETNKEIKMEKILKRLHQQIIEDYGLYAEKGLSSFIERWQKFSIHRENREIISYKINGKQEKSRLYDLYKDGVLLISEKDEKIKIPWKEIIDLM